MTEREKLAESLQNYYNSQRYTVPSGGWNGGAAAKKNKRRKLALWFFFIGGFVSVFMALLTSYASSDGSKNEIANSTGKPVDVGILSVIKQNKNKTQVPSIEKGKPKLQLLKPVTKQIKLAQETVLNNLDSKDIAQEKTEVLTPSSIVVADATLKTESTGANTVQLESPTPSNQATDSNINTSASAKDSVMEVANRETLGSFEKNAHTSAIVTEPPPEINETNNLQSTDSSKPQIPALETDIVTKKSPVLKDSINKKEMAQQEEKIDSTLSLMVPNSAQQLGLSFELGAAYLLGWNTGSTRDAGGFTPYGGFNYSSSVADKLAFSVGLQYFQVAGLSASTKTSKVSSFAYGETSKITQITPLKLHYALVPLRFIYLPDSKQQIGIGVNLAYLLNVDAEVSTYQQSPMGITEPKKNTESGYMQGFNWYDTQASVLYRRRLGRSFAFQSEVFFGLIDTKEDVFFSLKGKERNSGVKISLMYYLTAKQKQHGA